MEPLKANHHIQINRLRLYLAVIASILVSLVLTALPLPSFAVIVWPYWTTLVLIYWCLALPNDFNIKFGFTVGLLTDFVYGTIIGQYALIYTVIAYMTMLRYSRMRLHSILQQSFVIGLLLTWQLMMSLWTEGMLYDIKISWTAILPVLTSILLWPWVFSVLRFLRHQAYQLT